MNEKKQSCVQTVGCCTQDVGELLKSAGIDLDSLLEGDECVQCVVVAPKLQGCVRELSKSSRDRVVMVRTDEATTKELDAWVETGALKSRSEAAAVFLRAGLGVYASELKALSESLGEVEAAKDKLREKVKEVLGDAKPKM